AGGTSAETEAAQRPHPAHLIVLLALRFVGEHRVRLADLLEALGGLRIVRVRVRMVLLRETAVRLLDLVGARALRDAEDLVEVLRGSSRHRLSPRADTRAPVPAAPAARRTGSPSGRRPLPARPAQRLRWARPRSLPCHSDRTAGRPGR